MPATVSIVVDLVIMAQRRHRAGPKKKRYISVYNYIIKVYVTDVYSHGWPCTALKGRHDRPHKQLCRFCRWDLAVENYTESAVWVVMSGVDAAPTPSLTSHHDPDPDILDHDLLSPSHHAVLPTHDHRVALDLDLTCLAQPDTALDDPAAHIVLQHSRDHIFGDIDHVGDHVEDDHITMVEAVDPAVTQQDSQQQSPESSLELKRVKVSFSSPLHPAPGFGHIALHSAITGRAAMPATSQIPPENPFPLSARPSCSFASSPFA